MVGRLGLVAMIVLAGCDQVYGLTGRDEHDASIDDATSDTIDTIEIDAAVCTVCDDEPTDVHDEDGDCTRDPCDPCPQLANMNLDGDDDGVGNECDPLSAGPPHGARFEGFDNFDELHLRPPTAWRAASAEDTLHRIGAANAFAFSNLESKASFQLDTTIDIGASAAGVWDAGFVFGANQTETSFNGWFVGIHRELLSTDDFSIVLYRIQGTTFTSISTVIGFPPADSVRLVLGLEGTAVTLTVRAGTESVNAIFTISPALAPMTYYGVGVRGPGDVQFRYLQHVQLK